MQCTEKLSNNQVTRSIFIVNVRERTLVDDDVLSERDRLMMMVTWKI